MDFIKINAEVEQLPEDQRDVYRALLSFGQTYLATKRTDAEVERDIEAHDKYVVTLARTLLPVIKAMEGAQFPALPEIERARLTMLDLFGDDCPEQIAVSDLLDARRKLKDADEELPFDEDEQALYDAVTEAVEKLDNHGADAIIHWDAVNEVLNARVYDFDIPDWLNDNIDWDAVYDAVKYNSAPMEIDGETYIILDI